MKSTTSPAEEFTAAARKPFAYRNYQREDLARSAIHDGAILAWDPGLGKTMAIFGWPFIKRANLVLIVAPADLHTQIIAEGLAKFRVEVTSIPDQATALDLIRAGKLPAPGATPAAAGDAAMPRFFVTDYRWLGYNGGDEWAAGEAAGDDDDGEGKVSDIIRRRRMAVIAHHLGMSGSGIILASQAIRRMSGKSCPAHVLLGVPPDAQRSVIKAAYRDIARLTHPDLHPEDPTATARMQRLNAAAEFMLKGDATAIVKGLDDEVREFAPTVAAMMAGVGRTRTYTRGDGAHTIRCIWAPTLSTILADCFDCVVADEAVWIKSGVTYVASGVLGLNPKFRLALTGTPIKNRLPDIFFLASWVCGSSKDATARWPYGNTTAHQAAFANNHLVMEENLTKEDKSRNEGKFRRYVKQTNKITNVHLLWKMLGPIVARRRKDSIGNDIVGKTIRQIKVLPGTEQQAVYQWHIANPPAHATPVASLGAQLQNLRMAALCPWSPNLLRPGFPASKSSAGISPKLLAIVHLAADLMAKGEQLVVFSPFCGFSTALSALLTEAGVPSLLLDGRVKNTKRGEKADDFKNGKYAVLIGGIKSMGTGHSFECAAHLVIPSLEWAYDSNRQAIDRIHRLSSTKDVTIYLMVTVNTVDERLAAIFAEKGDASDLALDGRLFEEDKQDVSLGDLIRSATLDFDPDAKTLPEASLAQEWNTTLRDRLASSAAAFTLCKTAGKPRLATTTKPDLFEILMQQHHAAAAKPVIRPAASNILPFPTPTVTARPARRAPLTPEQVARLASAFA
jgi:hypothetical protein